MAQQRSQHTLQELSNISNRAKYGSIAVYAQDSLNSSLVTNEIVLRTLFVKKGRSVKLSTILNTLDMLSEEKDTRDYLLQGKINSQFFTYRIAKEID